MKETISYKQQRTLTVTDESLSGFNLAINLSLDRTVGAEMDAIPASISALKEDLKDIAVTLGLKGQSKDEIRIFDNISLYDILKDKTANDHSFQDLNILKLNRLNNETFITLHVFLPTGVINLQGNEQLDLKVVFNNFAISQNGTVNGYLLLDSSNITISSKNVVAKQQTVKTLERIDLDDMSKKKYNFEGNVAALALCDVDNDASLHDFIEANVKSDLLETTVVTADVATNLLRATGNGYDNEYLPLLVTDTPLKNLTVEVVRENIADNEMYFLVRKEIFPINVYKRYQAKSKEHLAENMTRLLSN